MTCFGAHRGPLVANESLYFGTAGESLRRGLATRGARQGMRTMASSCGDRRDSIGHHIYIGFYVDFDGVLITRDSIVGGGDQRERGRSTCAAAYPLGMSVRTGVIGSTRAQGRPWRIVELVMEVSSHPSPAVSSEYGWTESERECTSSGRCAFDHRDES